MLLRSSLTFKRCPGGFYIQGKRLAFQSSWTLCVGVVLLSCLFASLAAWQAGRYFERQAVMALRQAKALAPPIPVTIVEQITTEDHQYDRLALAGDFIDDRCFLFDNQIHQGQVGYHVLCPFALAAEQPWLLVNRGWLPIGESRQTLPALPKSEKSIQITGTLDKPLYNRLVSEPIESSQTHWPLRIQNQDIEAMAQRLGHPLVPWVLQLERGDRQAFALSETTPWLTPMRHQVYALQWLSFLIITWSFWIRLNLRKSAHAKNP